jgi:hypothetical protein
MLTESKPEGQARADLMVLLSETPWLRDLIRHLELKFKSMLFKWVSAQTFDSPRPNAIKYPASAQVTPGVRAGVVDVVERLNSQVKACPNQVFALVGYSQGAAVMNSAAPKIPTDIAEKKIKALVMFGEPNLQAGRIILD